MILFYTYDKEKSTQIEKIAADIGERPVRISPADLSSTVGECLRMADTGKRPAASGRRIVQVPPMYSMPEMLIFSGLKDKTLDLFLEKYKQSGCTQIACKAIVTPTNIGWTIYELAQQLRTEIKGIL